MILLMRFVSMKFLNRSPYESIPHIPANRMMLMQEYFVGECQKCHTFQFLQEMGWSGKNQRIVKNHFKPFTSIPCEGNQSPPIPDSIIKKVF
jgi:hypothetical protein